MQLSAQQQGFFDAFGYLAFPGLLADCIDRITDEFEVVWAAHRGGHDGRPHEGKARSCLFPFIDRSERLSALLDDPRILAIASSLVAEDFNYMGSDGNYYVGDSGWHSDDWTPGFLRIKIAIYLDPLTRETGCLRVMPGSHRVGDRYAEGLQAQLRHSEEAWGVHGRDLPAVALETRPGDVLCFNQNCKHASFGGSARRRMFTINCSPRYPEERLQQLRDYCSAHVRFLIPRLYGEAMLRTAGPERLRHLEQVASNDGHMAELLARAREQRLEPARG